MAPRLAAEAFLTVADVRSGECSCCITLDTSDADILSWIDQASDIIAIVTGMTVYGKYQVVLRPCRVGIRCGCDCCHLDAVPLGDPRPTVDHVYIDGLGLDPSEYDLHWTLNGWNLVRIGDGTRAPDPWPSYQDLWKQDTEDKTFAIYVSYGVDIAQPIIVNAAQELVCELATQELAGRSSNELAPGIVSAQLGGTTVQVDRDILERIKAGTLGPAVNQLLGLFAPQGRSKSAVWAPELQADTWAINARPAAVVGS